MPSLATHTYGRAATLLTAVLLSPVLLTAVPAAAQATPAPELLAFDNGGVTVSSPPGSPPRRVLDGYSSAAVFPDDSRLVSVSTASLLYVSDRDGGGPRRLTSESDAVREVDPAVAPAGGRVAYSRYDDTTGVPQLAVADVASGRVMKLGVRGSEPVWSPDGRFLAFTPDGRTTDVIDSTGRGQVRLTSTGAPTDWSPTGRELALRTDRDTVRLLSLGTRSARTVISPSTGPEGAYRTYRTSTFAASSQQLYVHTLATGPNKGDLSSAVERFGLDGSADASFPPLTSVGFDTHVSDGGGTRATPVRTQPEAVIGLAADAAPSAISLRYSRRTAPHTAGVTVRYAVGTTPPATVTDGQPGPESLASTATIGQLAPGTTYSISVFTRDWSGAASAPATTTATTPSQIDTTLTLDGPGRITYGDGSTLSGRLTRGDTGAAVTSARLTLVGHHEGDPDSVLQSLTTDADGRFSTRRLTSEATRYAVRYAGDGPLLADRASTLVLVRPRITITLSPSARVPAYSQATLSVQVLPAFPGGHVRLEQQLYGGGPNVLTRLDRNSRASIRLATGRRQAENQDNIRVTAGYRRGYVADLTYTTFLIY